GGVVIRRPRIYQGRVEIAGRFRLHRNREASFEIAPYNPALPLVIDPMVELTSLLGTADDDRPTAVAFDAAGNIFIAGTTNSRFFPLTGAVQGTNAGGYDVFLMKLNPTANVVLFSTLLGGSGDDQPLALTIDAAGNPYIGGVTRSPNFPVTSGSLQVIATGARDGFISKLNSAGSLLLASTYLGASDEDQVSALALDPAGNVYVTGVTRSLNFPTSPNAVRRALAALSDAFVAKLDGGLSRLLYSTYLGGNQDDLGNAIAVTPTGVAFVSGSTRSNNFPTTLNAQQRNLQAGTDAFLTRVSADGDRFEYSSYLGGRGDDAGRAILTDSAGLVYVAGSTGSPDFPNSAAPTPSIYTGGLFDGFLTTFQFPANPNPSAILVDGTLVRTVFCCGAGGRQLWTGTSLVAAPDGSAAAIHTAGFSDVALPAFPTADLAFPDCPRNGLLRGVFGWCSGPQPPTRTTRDRFPIRPKPFRDRSPRWPRARAKRLWRKWIWTWAGSRGWLFAATTAPSWRRTASPARWDRIGCTPSTPGSAWPGPRRPCCCSVARA
ncbi:MAG: SBBP repeat-containing protein, partial [Acidobacteria bacterium]|nr:SBBP repeat-containing protein [Acidobacteriota bacterium]